ncbi:hypothetical protein V3468_03370 [Flavobacterium oreochromis]|uniref:hypothetical protein n=1 Tax=Flavobacterium oreochromis TaxID=2906078 RepID=UPI00385C25A3
MKKYTTIEWKKALLWLIPPLLRKRTHFDWLNVLLSPLKKIYEETLYKMQHTGQVIYLEKVLNETFNTSKTYNPNYSTKIKKDKALIFIDETIKPKHQYIYLHSEYEQKKYIIPPKIYLNDEPEKNELLKPLYLVHKDDSKVRYADFRVFIPNSISFMKSKYRDILDFYKLAGKTYEFIKYTPKNQ